MNFAKLGCLFLMVPARRKATASSPHPMPVWMMWLASESCGALTRSTSRRSWMPAAPPQAWQPTRKVGAPSVSANVVDGLTAIRSARRWLAGSRRVHFSISILI
ncbi:unnamed protein product [Cladocopium goreaui]|uniref:Uncharacterized protein n=1 Tax=Cladocopium goreaui TaxID=2562237 RepID=A0A9P1FDN4_9DINO|nr:unnamed protein product [Cladocopium goreaui]